MWTTVFVLLFVLIHYSASQVIIFDDAWRNNFSDNAADNPYWTRCQGCEVKYNSDYKVCGSGSLQFISDSRYQDYSILSIGNEKNLTIADYQYLDFWIFVALYVDPDQKFNYSYSVSLGDTYDKSFTPRVNISDFIRIEELVWAHVSIPFSAFNTSKTNFTLLKFHYDDNRTNSRAYAYLDSISLLPFGNFSNPCNVSTSMTLFGDAPNPDGDFITSAPHDSTLKTETFRSACGKASLGWDVRRMTDPTRGQQRISFVCRNGVKCISKQIHGFLDFWIYIISEGSWTISYDFGPGSTSLYMQQSDIISGNYRKYDEWVHFRVPMQRFGTTPYDETWSQVNIYANGYRPYSKAVQYYIDEIRVGGQMNPCNATAVGIASPLYVYANTGQFSNLFSNTLGAGQTALGPKKTCGPSTFSLEWDRSKGTSRINIPCKPSSFYCVDLYNYKKISFSVFSTVNNPHLEVEIVEADPEYYYSTTVTNIGSGGWKFVEISFPAHWREDYARIRFYSTTTNAKFTFSDIALLPAGASNTCTCSGDLCRGPGGRLFLNGQIYF